MHIDGHEVRSRVRPNVTGNQWHAEDTGLRVHAKAQTPGFLRKRSGRTPALQIFPLNLRLVRPLAYTLHIQVEEEIPHRGVSRHNNFVDLLSAEIETPANLLNFMVHGIDNGSMQLATECSSVIRDAVHDIASSEPLRILKGADAHSPALLQIHKLCSNSSGAQVDRQTVNVTAILVYDYAVIAHRLTVASDNRIMVEKLFGTL